MPLEPLPPPSPRGKTSHKPNPPEKHKCMANQPCPILLSDIGRVFHTMPKGYLKLRYSLPSLPKFVMDHYNAHPFSWSWTTRSGPNEGKSFSVPHIPTHCKKSDHRAVRWTVDLFHSFKAHLSPAALDEKGRVLKPIVRIFRNNMLIHYHRQSALSKAASTRAPPPLPNPPNRPRLPPKNPPALKHEHLHSLPPQTPTLPRR
jgi:hypothetical protein